MSKKNSGEILKNITKVKALPTNTEIEKFFESSPST